MPIRNKWRRDWLQCVVSVNATAAACDDVTQAGVCAFADQGKEGMEKVAGSLSN